MRIGPIDDPLEREADRVADSVVSGRSTGTISGMRSETARRKCAECEKEEEKSVQRKCMQCSGETNADGGSAETAAKAVSQGGAPLTRAQRGYFEPRFGRDFSAIRVHTGHEATSAAERIDARAFALGENIAFARGEYRPDTDAGRLLIAHELAHTLQQQHGDAPAIRRAPEDAPKDKPPDVPVTLAAKDLLVYPLFIDLWSDIFAQKFTEKQKQEFKLKGTESAAIWNLIFAGAFAGRSLEASSTFGDFLEGWVKNAKEIHRIAGSEKFYLDFFSRFVGINLDSYLGSELFKSRLKTHAASLGPLLVAAQIALSTVMAVKKSSAKPGELEATDWEKHTLLVSTLFSVILAEQIKAPDFFNIGPLKLATHPAFAAYSPVAGGPPPELVFEHKKGEGQEGELLKAGLTLNLAQIVALFQKDAPPAKELADLQKNQGLQTSLWLSYDKIDPTALQRESGKLPSKSLHGGLLVGGNGVLVQLENGVRYTGDDAKALTGLFVRGGFGYAGKKGQVIQKLGFTATYTEWTEKDIYAPRIGAGGEAVAGNAAQFTPFAKVEVGSRHKFGAGAALGFVTGTGQDFNLSDFRGDLSYTYLGDRSADQLPIFKLDLSATYGKLDWFAPDSPALTGFQARANIGQYFFAGQINTGAGKIPDQRAAQIAERPSDKLKVQVPTAVVFTAGTLF
ncbi:MAG: DUF4157 domain-containing protein [Rhizobiales bacterium]|nr:DUF4157 domain-containing protein [Hyphomicrobiales bacterium]